ncbi:hypothetical protein GF337_11800 [candidate division KSB1 bacterium]|nr:hypothetical protein [candidate division KSB1 bacterium]
MKKYLNIIFLILILTTGISASEKDDRNNVLAQLDSTMWKYLAIKDTSQWTITPEDSEKVFKEYFVNGYRVFRKVTKLQDRIKRNRTTYEKAAPQLEKLLTEAREKFEQGLKENPLDKYLKQAITRVYYDLVQLYNFKKDDANRLQIFMNILQFEQKPRTRVILNNQAGMIFFREELWEPAKERFRLAVNLIFEGEESEIDSSALFTNIYFRGQSYMKLYDADSALISLTRARMIAPGEKEYEQITSLINFINWDEGNIRASEMYYDCRMLASNKEYEKAESDYLDLIDMIQSDRAKYEANYRLSLIQFNRLDKRDEGVARLWNVVKLFEENPLPDKDGFVSEASYWENYSYMCVQMANQYLATDRKKAFVYYYKAAQIEGPDRGRAYLGLAGIAFNSAEVCLDYCNRAYEYEYQLNEGERKNLYNLFYLAHKRKGDFAESVKWYDRFTQI